MSICSFCSINASFPLGTELDVKSPLWRSIDEKDGKFVLYTEGDGVYSDYALEDVVDLFGKPLDEVPGLSLECYYEYMEDDGWRFRILVEDGEVTCEQTETRWVDCTVDELGIGPVISMGHEERVRQENINHAKSAWKSMEDFLVDDDGKLTSAEFVQYLGRYPEGTQREEIWHDIEEKFGVSVAWLMGEAKNPDGTN